MRRDVPVLIAALALAVPAVASADTTLGLTTAPSGATATNCGGGPMFVQISDDPASPYRVPASANGVMLKQWSINTTGDTPGASVTLYVLAPTSTAGTYTLVKADTEMLPTPLPTNNIATFTPSAPITVATGDTWGIAATGGTVDCYFEGGSTPTGDMLAIDMTKPTAPGQTVTTASPSPPGITLNLGITLAPANFDAGLSLTAGPSNAVVGQPALLTATVTDSGPVAGPVTFTDAVPAGLTVDYAAVTGGSCTTGAANVVTCSLTNVPVGQSEKVVIVVTPTAARSYSDRGAVTITGGGTDPNQANNAATATLKVSAPGAPTSCAVPPLGGQPLALAKRFLTLFGCSVGKVTKSHSKSVPKGDVISTNPRAGTYTLGRKIAITVSSGKPTKKKHKK